MDLEALAVVSFAAVACGALLAPAASRLSPRLRLLGLGLLAGLALFAWMSLSFRYVEPDEALVADRPSEVPSDGYVGSDSCRACHPGEYATWHSSYHSTMTQTASEESVQASFDGVPRPAGDAVFTMVEEEGRHWVRVERDAVDGPGRIEERWPIVLTTGSHHMQVYWYATEAGRDLSQLPWVWLTEDEAWIPRNMAFLRPPGRDHADEVGRWNRECLRCHSVGGKPLAFEDGVLTRVSEFGIACEACHGPGDEHVAANRRPDRRFALARSGDGDPTVVEPSTLAHGRDSEVCGQCHSLWLLEADSPEHQFNTKGTAYRPGDDLTATRRIVKKGRDKELVARAIAENPGYLASSFWQDGVPKIAGAELTSLHASECFSQGDLSCMDCHSLHRGEDEPLPTEEWRQDQLRGDRLGDEACLHCHEDLRGHEEEHGQHPRGVADCQTCHMPFTAYGLMGAVRDHAIRSPSVSASEVGRPNACSACHLDQPLTWASAELTAFTGGTPAEADAVGPAAIAQWVLMGDAHQRALAAWYLGWQPARDAAGTEWMAPYLALLLDDDYAVVRLIASRSLRTLPGYEALAPRPDAHADGWASARASVLAQWARGARAGQPALLILPDGTIDQSRWNAMLADRDNRPILIAE